MIRRFNYTQRRRIPRRAIHLVTATFPRHQLQEVSWQLDKLGFPEDASVYLEATSSGTPAVLRIPWGTVDSGKPPDVDLRSLEELPGENVFFDFKVVDETEDTGRILGLARHIRPRGAGEDEDDTGSSALLPVNPVDLGAEIWRVDFTSGRPFLEVNRAIPGIMDIVRSDMQFFSLVYPEVIRRILLQILIIEDVQEPDASGDWKGQWLAWGCLWHPDATSPPEGEHDSAVEERLKWIEEVSVGFASQRQTKQLFEEARGGRDPS
jgi:hypothetical protein